MMRHEIFDDRSGELDLVDIWLVFTRYWKLLAAFVLAGVLAGGLYAFTRTPSYQFQTLIEIGTHIVNDEFRPIDQPESAKAKIEKGYLTLALREYHAANPDDLSAYDVAVSIPDKSDVIVISSEGPESDLPALQAIHANIVSKLKVDHDKIIDVIRQDLKTELVASNTQLEALAAEASYLEAQQQRLAEQHKNRMASLEQQVGLTQSELVRLEEENKNRLAMLDEQIALRRIELKRQEQTEALVEGQIQNLEALLQRIRQDQTSAVSEATDEARAMTMLLIHNQVQQASEQLASLKERRDVGIPNARSRLEKEIQDLEKQKLIVSGDLANKRDHLAADVDDARRGRENTGNELQAERERFSESIDENQRNQRTLQAAIDQIALRLENLKETSAPVIATQSMRPVSSGAMVLTALAVVLAGMLGVMCIVFLQLSRLARERRLDTGARAISHDRSSLPSTEYRPLKKVAT